MSFSFWYPYRWCVIVSAKNLRRLHKKLSVLRLNNNVAIVFVCVHTQTVCLPNQNSTYQLCRLMKQTAILDKRVNLGSQSSMKIWLSYATFSRLCAILTLQLRVTALLITCENKRRRIYCASARTRVCVHYFVLMQRAESVLEGKLVQLL